MQVQRMVQVGRGDIPCTVTLEHEGDGVMVATSIKFGWREIINRVTFKEIERIEDSITAEEMRAEFNKNLEQLKIDLYA